MTSSNGMYGDANLTVEEVHERFELYHNNAREDYQFVEVLFWGDFRLLQSLVKRVADLMYKNERLDKEAKNLLDGARALEREKNGLTEKMSKLNTALVEILRKR